MSRDIDRRSFLKVAGGAAAAATTATAGCVGGGGGSGGTLRYGRGADSSTLDPQATTSGEVAKVTNQIFDTLVTFKPEGASLTQGLATDWSMDGTTATITLREDAKFHDGEDFTADDFIATYRRFLDPEYEHFIGEKNQSIYGPYLLGDVKNVEKTGDYEVEFEIATKYAPFVRNLGVFALAVLSKKQIESDEKVSDNPIGTGAFQFDEWDTGNKIIRLSAHGDYWGDGPQVENVLFEAINQNSTRAQSLDAQELDIVDGLGAQAAQQVKDSSNAKLLEKAGLNVGYMAFNMARMEAFRDKKVRKAISHAINTKEIVQSLYKGMAVQSSQPIPPGMMGHDDELSPYAYDPEKAKSLLKEAGYEDGFSFQLAVMNNPRPYFPSPKETANTVQSNLKEVGIDVTLEEKNWDPYLTYTAEGKHDACFLGWITDNADADNFYSPLLMPGVAAEDVPSGQDWVGFDTEGFNTSNRAAWANTEFMKKVKSAKTTYDEDARKSTYDEVADLVHEEAPWVFVTHTKELRGVANGVSGFQISPVGGPALHTVSKDGGE
jgi:peptide/nickel transport system substrate-binding protein